MVDRDLLASKLGELAGHLARVRTRRTVSAEDLRRDRDALDLVALGGDVEPDLSGRGLSRQPGPNPHAERHDDERDDPGHDRFEYIIGLHGFPAGR